MKKVHVKMNKVLAAVLSVLLVCSAVSMDHVFADTVSSGQSSGEVSDGVNITEPAGGADTDAPADGTDANGSAWAVTNWRISARSEGSRVGFSLVVPSTTR